MDLEQNQNCTLSKLKIVLFHSKKNKKAGRESRLSLNTIAINNLDQIVTVLPAHEVSENVQAIQIGRVASSIHISSSHRLPNMVVVCKNREDVVYCGRERCTEVIFDLEASKLD